MANTTKRSSSQLHILYSEGNPEVLTSQAAVLEKAGHQVETALGRKAVEEAVRKNSYDWVVLGPTLSKNDRHHLPYMAKKAKERLRVLVMHTDGEGHPAVDANLDTGATIEDLVAKIASLDTRATMAKSAAAPH
jgi:DNA-binding NtrC family response regulator